MMRWLPCCRTAANPCRSRIRQMSEPDRTRSLPNRNLDLSDKDLVAQPAGHLGGSGCLEKQGQRFDQVDSRFFNRRTLTGNIEFRAQRHKTVVLTFDDRGQMLRWLHGPSLHQFKWTKRRLCRAWPETAGM